MQVRKNFPKLLDQFIVSNWDLALCSPLINPQILHFCTTSRPLSPWCTASTSPRAAWFMFIVIIGDFKDLCPQKYCLRLSQFWPLSFAETDVGRIWKNH